MTEAPVTAYLKNPDGSVTAIRSIHEGTKPEAKPAEDLASKTAKKSSPAKPAES